MEEIAFRLLDHLEWHGVAMVEFKLDDRTGKPVILEVNPRFWGSLSMAISAGVDFPWLLYQMTMEGDVTPVNEYRLGVRSRCLLTDIVSFARHIKAGKISFPYLKDFSAFMARNHTLRIFRGAIQSPSSFISKIIFSQKMLKGDFHIHSSFSFDSFLKPSTIVEIAIRKGLDFIAITDHNTIQGAVETRKLAGGNISVIIGAEIKTNKGDILGLFLNEEIKSRTACEVINEIRQQGGLAILPHPFKDELRFSAEEIGKFDAIEVNARMSKWDNKKAAELGKKFTKPLIAGSDAHFAWEIGRAFNCLPSISDLQEGVAHQKIRIDLKASSYVNTLLSYAIGRIKRPFDGRKN